MKKDTLPRGAELFSISDEAGDLQNMGHIVVCGEEKGGTDALIPVVRELIDRGFSVSGLLAGIGLEVFTALGKEKYKLQLEKTNDLVPTNEEPDAILLSPSVDGRLERYLGQSFASPRVLIEDFYESSRYVLSKGIEDNIEPPTVCVIDEDAKRLMKRRFPNVSIPVEITGSPSFDSVFNEDVDRIREQKRIELGIGSKSLVAFMMPPLGHTMLAEQVAESFRELDNTVFAVRPHMRDTISQSAYEKIFDGIPHVGVSIASTKGLGAAADVVITQRSTYGLSAAVRQQPNISLRDFVPSGFTLPLVDAGLSLESTPVKLASDIEELLEGSSERCDMLRQKMAEYRVDGKSASRVADVVCRQLVVIN